MRRRPSRKPSVKRAIAADDLLRLQLLADPQISPDGQWIVVVKKHVGEKNEYVTNLWLADAAAQSPPRQFTHGGKDGHPRWSPDGKRIAFAGREGEDGIYDTENVDLRCNIEQAEQVFTVLKLNRVPTRFVRYPASTSHGLSRTGPTDLRIHRLNQILQWFRQWL